ncbi:hypothetical protein ACHAWF_010925, partial [Thalassiosira exigua]
IGFQRGDKRTKEENVHFDTLCCYKGCMNSISFYSLHLQLEHLYTAYEDDPLSKHFLYHARTYNNGMAMPSLALEKGKRWQTRAHKLESMLTASGQLIRRVEDATYYRLQNFQNIPKRQKDTYEIVLKQLHGIIKNAGNKYVQSYIGGKDYVEQHLKNKVWDVKLSLHANESADKRIHSGLFNAPAVKEMAILLPNDITANHNRQVVVNYMHDDNESGLRIISDFHKAYDPL